MRIKAIDAQKETRLRRGLRRDRPRKSRSKLVFRHSFDIRLPRRSAWAKAGSFGFRHFTHEMCIYTFDRRRQCQVRERSVVRYGESVLGRISLLVVLWSPGRAAARYAITPG